MPSVHWAHPWSQERMSQVLGTFQNLAHWMVMVLSNHVQPWLPKRSWADLYPLDLWLTKPAHFPERTPLFQSQLRKLWEVVPRCACRASRGQMLGNRGVTVRQQRQLVVRKSVQQKAGSTFSSGMMMITVIIVVIIKLILIWTLCTHVDNTKT